MKTEPMAFGCTSRIWIACFVWLISLVKAAAFPECFPTSISMEVGEERQIQITAPHDVENPTSVFKLTTIGNTSVVEVTPGVGVERAGKDTVVYTIRALAPGSTSLVFNWRDAKKGFTGPCSASVFVRQPAQTAANVTPVTTAGDPINTRTGEYFGVESVDLNLGGPMPLHFTRYYGSRLSTDGRVLPVLGFHRSHNFNSRLVISGLNHRDVVTDRGRAAVFQKQKKGWVLTGRSDIPYRLIQDGTNFIFCDPHSQWTWTYDGGGKLAKIEDGRGNAHALTYNASNQLSEVADGLGRTLSFIYTSGRITRVTDHTGRQVNFAYTGALLSTATDPLNETTTYAYNGSSQLVSFTRPEGNTPFTQVYTAGQVTSQTERGTDTSTIAYGGTTTTFTDPTAATIVDQYAATGELTSHVDQAGKAINFTNDATGRRSMVVDRLGHATRITYHALSGKPETITNAAGLVTKFAYKPRLTNRLPVFDLVKVTQADRATVSFAYDKKGNVTTATDQAGKRWKFTHNERGQILTAKNPAGGVFQRAYDAAGNVISTRDPDTEPALFAYDALNRLVTITRPGGDTASIVYDARDRVTSITDERGKTYEFAYDGNGRVTTITDPDSNDTAFAYDALDRVTQVTDRLGEMSSVVYDARRLVSSVTNRNGNTTSFSYDSRQRLTGTEDPGGQAWGRGYDDEGLLTNMATPLAPSVRIKRNQLGRPVEVSNALGETVSLQRDAMQRVVERADPLGRTRSFSYDKRGLLASVTEQGTGTAKYERDGLGLLSKIVDPNGASWAFGRTSAGRLSTLSDPLGRKLARAYDGRGRVSGITFADGKTVTWTYDEASNLTRRLYTDGTDIVATYDNLNRLASTNGLELSYDAESRVTNCRQNSLDFQATYDPGGRLATVSYADAAAVVTCVYDTRNRLTRVSDNRSNAQIDFAYDDAGRLTGITRSNGVNVTYSYDLAGRLIRVQDGPAIDLQYSLNAAGEVTSVQYEAPLIPAVSPATQALAFNKASEIATAGYSYDARGRLTAAPSLALAWDDASRLTSANGVALAYNGMGDLILRTAGPAVTRYSRHYALRGAPIVYESPESGGAATAYVWTPSGCLLYSFDFVSLQPRFYHFDRLGSTLAISDHTGAITDAYAYGPYGEPLGRTGSSAQPFTYLGAMGVRTEAGLCQMRARYYHPETARFISRDPVWPSLGAPKRLNPYEYAAQSPGQFIDPSGTEEAYFDVARNYYENGEPLGASGFFFTQVFDIFGQKSDDWSDSVVRPFIGPGTTAADARSVPDPLEEILDELAPDFARGILAAIGEGDPDAPSEPVKTFVLPHVLEKSGIITGMPNSFDTQIFMNDASGSGAAPASGGPGGVDLFVFGNLEGTLVKPGSSAAGHDGSKPPTDGRSMTRSALRLGESDPPRPADRVLFQYDYFGRNSRAGGDVPLHGFVVNAHTSPFDLSVFGFEPQPLATP